MDTSQNTLRPWFEVFRIWFGCLNARAYVAFWKHYGWLYNELVGSPGYAILFLIPVLVGWLLVPYRVAIGCYHSFFYALLTVGMTLDLFSFACNLASLRERRFISGIPGLPCHLLVLAFPGATLTPYQNAAILSFLLAKASDVALLSLWHFVWNISPGYQLIGRAGDSDTE